MIIQRKYYGRRSRVRRRNSWFYNLRHWYKCNFAELFGGAVNFIVFRKQTVDNSMLSEHKNKPKYFYKLYNFISTKYIYLEEFNVLPRSHHTILSNFVNIESKCVFTMFINPVSCCKLLHSYIAFLTGGSRTTSGP